VLQPRQCAPIRDECSWSAPTHIEVAPLVSQITTPRRPRAPLFATLCCPVQQLECTHAVCATAFAQPSCLHTVVFCCIAAACLICRCCSLVQPKNLKALGDILEDWGLSKQSDLKSVLVSFEHEAGLFYTRHQNPYKVAT